MAEDLYRGARLFPKRGALSAVVDIVWPPRSLLTEAIVAQPGAIEPALWGELKFLTDPLCARCGFPLPEDFSGWLACTARGDDAFATTAQRVFHRLERTASGGIRLPEELHVPGTRYTVYAVDAAGSMRVAELRLPGQSPTLLDTASPARQPEEKES